jgi:hypothetical protein
MVLYRCWNVTKPAVTIGVPPDVLSQYIGEFNTVEPCKLLPGVLPPQTSLPRLTTNPGTV